MLVRMVLLSVPCLFACRTSAPLAARTPADLGDVVEAYADASGAVTAYDRGVRELLEATPVQRVVGPDGDRLEVGAPRAVEPELAVEVLPLRHAEARATAAMVDELLRGDSRRGSGQARILADPRTNALVVSASEAQLARVKQIVGLLDVESPQG